MERASIEEVIGLLEWEYGPREWQPGRKAVGVREELEQREEEGTAAIVWRDFLEQHRSWAVSAFVHTVIIVVLGLWTLAMPSRPIYLVSMADEVDESDLEQFDDIEIVGPKIEPVGGDIVDRVEPEPLEP